MNKAPPLFVSLSYSKKVELRNIVVELHII